MSSPSLVALRSGKGFFIISLLGWGKGSQLVGRKKSHACINESRPPQSRERGLPVYNTSLCEAGQRCRHLRKDL